MATQSSSRYSPMQTYQAPSVPIITANDNGRALNAELRTLQAVLASTQAMITQAATAAPSQPVDGMVRLARAPWRPVAGVTTDAWVYFDSPSNAWKLRDAAPTNTGA